MQTPNSADNKVVESAREAGLICCEYCNGLSTIDQQQCRCCGSTIHSRRRNSVSRCWALTLSAIILLIPANMLPVMTISAFGQGEPDTIISGIISLFQHGLYPIGMIVFVASIMVPILKIIGLLLLLLSLDGKIAMNKQLRTRMFRVIEFFGKWSMLDVFVVTFLVALVNIGGIATVNAGLGITAFCLMVILTMLAANSFDTRLIWDEKEIE